MKKKVTAQMFEAAVAAGADPESLEIVDQEIYDALGNEGAGAGEGEGEGAGAGEGEGEGAGAGEGEGEGGEAVDYEAKAIELALELTEKNEQITTLTAEVETLKAASDSDPLKVIAIDRISVMRVALGMQAMDMKDFPVASIMNEYNALDKQFKKQFKTGGYLSEDAENTPKPKAVVTNIENAQLRAVGIK